MPKSKKPSDPEQVAEYMQKLKHPLADAVEALRQIILSADKEIAEEIKWNSPSFYYTGEMQPFDPKEYKRHIIVMNLHKQNQVMLVFPTGAKVNDTTGLLEGNYTDGRRLMIIKDAEDAKAKGKGLQKVIKDWLALVEK